MARQVVQSFEVVKEMLRDRKMDTSALDAYSQEELIALCKHSAIFHLPVSEEMDIVYYMHSKFKLNDIRKFVLQNPKRKMVIFKERINNLNVRNLRETGVPLDIFMLKELMYNVSKNDLVPKHEVISDPEAIAEVMRMYDIKQKTQLPVILRTDPMARYLDIKPGELVRITRVSASAGESLAYRVCA